MEGYGFLRRAALGLARRTFPFWAPGYYRLRPAARTLQFRGKTYHHFFHPYNVTWHNERMVEIPIVWEAVEANRGRRILEIGNVLSHYFPFEHDVVDKYERAPGVRNEDVVDFVPDEPYDLVVSISTLEHVGWDETPREPGKFRRAVDAVRGFLAEGGVALVTMPLGHNPELDRTVRSAVPGFDELYWLKRLSWHRWVEALPEELADVRFNSPYAGANGLVVGVIRRAPS